MFEELDEPSMGSSLLDLISTASQLKEESLGIVNRTESYSFW
jgi:hypothetical protein